MTNSRTGDRELSRREFSVESLMALFAGVVITVTACDDDGGPVNVGPGGSNVNGTISANHGHLVTVTSVQINAGNAVTVTFGGQSDHPHTLDLTASEVVQIGGGTRVSKTSSANGSAAFGTHDHTVTFN